MTYYSPVAPVDVLITAKERDFLDPYLLILAHDVVDQPDKYEKLLDGFKGTLILDNSLVELGKPVDGKLMVQAAHYTKPTYVVLPDKLYDAKETIRLSVEALHGWTKQLPAGTGVMAAAQGQTHEECAECFQAIAQCTNRPIIAGIPRVIANKHGTRAPTIQLIGGMRYNMHLLGMSDQFEDDITCARMFGVLGIDSASPLRAGWENKRYRGDTSKLRPRDQFFKDCRGFSLMMAGNIEYVRGRIHKNG